MEYYLLRRGGRAVAETEEWGGELANSNDKSPEERQASARGTQSKGCLLGQLAKPRSHHCVGMGAGQEASPFLKRERKYTALDPSENKCEQKHAHKKSVKFPKVLLNLNVVLLKNAREVPRLKSRAKTCIQARPGGTDLSSYIESRGQSGTHEILSLKNKTQAKACGPRSGGKACFVQLLLCIQFRRSQVPQNHGNFGECVITKERQASTWSSQSV